MASSLALRSRQAAALRVRIAAAAGGKWLLHSRDEDVVSMKRKLCGACGSFSPCTSGRSLTLMTTTKLMATNAAASSSASSSASALTYLQLDDRALLEQCRVDVYRASGPGGQHRNKTDSAVRITHLPTKCVAIAVESRSQHTNKASALKRLRSKIALNVATVPSMDINATHDEHIDNTLEQSSESPHAASPISLDDADADNEEVIASSYAVPPELAAILPKDAKGHRNKQRLGKKHPDYPKGIAVLLELFHQHEWSISRVATCVNMSTASLSKLVVADPKLKEAVNKSRQRQGMRPLR